METENFVMASGDQVERIRGKRYQNGKAYYLVRWAGYGPADDTWEPFSNLTRVLDLVVNFEVRYVLKKTPDVGEAAFEHAKTIVYKRLYRLIDGMEFLSDDEEGNTEESFYEDDNDTFMNARLPEVDAFPQATDIPIQETAEEEKLAVPRVERACQEVSQEMDQLNPGDKAGVQQDETERPCLFDALESPCVNDKEELFVKGSQMVLHLPCNDGVGDHSEVTEGDEWTDTGNTAVKNTTSPEKNNSTRTNTPQGFTQDQAAAGDEQPALPPVLAMIARRSVRVVAKMTEHESMATSDTRSDEPSSVEKPTTTPKKSCSTSELGPKTKTPSKRKHAAKSQTPGRQKRDLSQATRERSSPRKMVLRNTCRPPANGYEFITVRKEHGHVAIIFQGDKPARAMLRPEAFAELANVLRVADSDNNCKVVTVTGCGGVFCAGVDLTYLVEADLAGRRNAVRKNDVNNMAGKLRDAVDAIINFSKPLVCLVNGLARGFGTALVSLCDIAYASERAVFELPYSALLQTPEGCLSRTLPAIVGPAMAKDMVLMGRTLSAEEAFRAGLVSHVFIHEFFIHELKPTVPESMIDKPLPILRQTKKMMQRHLGKYELSECNEEEYTNLRTSWQAEECCKAVLTYVERERL